MNFTTAPAATVKKKFSASVSTSGGGDTTSPAIPPVSTADLAQQPIPDTGPSQSEIESFYKPLLDQIQNEQLPLSRPVPASISPTGTFLGLLAGNLASTFSQDPAFAHQARQYMAEQEKNKAAIEEQNYANELTFNVERRNKLITLRGKILETQLDKAIKDGDTVRALEISNNLAKLQESLKRESDKQEAERQKVLIQARGAEDRKTEKVRATLKTEEEKSAAAKPLTTKEYLGARNAVARNKELGKEAQSKWKLFGITLPFGPRDATPTEREEEAEGIDVATIKNGEPTAVNAAKANLKRSILKRLGLLGKPAAEFTSPELGQLATELEKYGLSPQDVQ